MNVPPLLVEATFRVAYYVNACSLNVCVEGHVSRLQGSKNLIMPHWEGQHVHYYRNLLLLGFFKVSFKEG